MWKKFLGDGSRREPSNHDASLTPTEGKREERWVNGKSFQTAEAKFQEDFG